MDIYQATANCILLLNIYLKFIKMDEEKEIKRRVPFIQPDVVANLLKKIIITINTRRRQSRCIKSDRHVCTR